MENPVNNFLTDKINWVPISGEFQAKGGEIFITIGDFYNTPASDYDSVGHGGTVAGFQSLTQTGYYIDDVYVRELTIANAGTRDTICNKDSVLIGNNSTTAGVSFIWQPATGLSNPNIAQPLASPTVTTTYTLIVVNDSVLAKNNRGQVCNCADSVTKDSVRVIVNTCTGINEIKGESEKMKVLPNPNNGNFTLSMNSISGEPEIEIYNVLGEKIYQAKVNTKNTGINLEKQAEGVYFYRVVKEDGGIVGSGKVLIVK